MATGAGVSFLLTSCSVKSGEIKIPPGTRNFQSNENLTVPDMEGRGKVVLKFV